MFDSVRPHRWQPTGLPRPWDSLGKDTGVGCHFLLQYMKGKVKVKLLSRARLFGEGDGTPLQYSCLENPMDRGAWKVAVHGVAKSQTRLSDFTFMHWRRKWQPTPVFLLGESQGRGSLVGCRLWGRTELDTTKAT